MKFKIVFFGFASFFLTPLFAQQSSDLVKLEKQTDSLYYQWSITRNEQSYELERNLREQVLESYYDTISPAYRLSLAKSYASEALFLLQREHDKYAEGIEASNTALKILETLEKQDLVLKGHIYLYLYHLNNFSYDREAALTMARKAKEVFMDTLVSHHKLVADAEFYIGYASGPLGDMDTALKQFKIAKEKYISFLGKNSYEVAEKCMHLATLYGFIGYYRMELDNYLESIEIWETIDHFDKSYQAIAYANVSTWYLWHGDFEKAEQYLIKNQDLIDNHKKEGKPWYNETYLGRTKIESLRKYATLNYYKGNLEEALKINDEILEFLVDYNVSDPNNDPNKFGVATINAWTKHQTRKALQLKADIIEKTDPDQAKNLHEQSLKIRAENGLTETSLPDFMYLGNYHLKKEDLTNSKKVWNQSVAEAERTTDEYALIQLYGKQGVIAMKEDSIHLMNQKYAQTFRLLQKDSVEQIDLKNLKYDDCKPYGTVPIINTIVDAAENYAILFKDKNNTSYLQNAFQLGSLASDMFSEYNRDFKYNDKSYSTVSKINEQLLNVALLYEEESRLNHVLGKIEQSKSRQTWKAFLSSNQRKNLNIPDSILEKENDLKAELHYYKKALFINNEGDSLKNSIWKEKILDIENAIDAVDLWYQKRYPTYYNQTKKEFDVASLQTKLAKKQVLINYVFAEAHVYAFTISKNKINLVRIGKKERVEQLVHNFLEALKNKTDTAYLELSKELHQIVLPSSIHSEEAKELIIVPDEVLHYLPFEVLTAANGTYVIQNHTVSYAPSLLLYQEQIGVKTSRKKKLGVFAPSYLKENKEEPERDSPTELKGAISEASTISKIFDGDFFTGENLSKKVFMKQAKTYNILHLAMHASLNNMASEFSNLDFSNGSENDKLFISELYGINVNADLAVLSACNTGVGELKKGEGITNVSRAFTYAGVPSTITSLWKVPDKQTSQIMVSFYNHLKNGDAKNKALQKAKLDYLASTDDDLLRHPYYWAGFVISGNIDPIVNPISHWWWMLLILPFLASIWYLKKKKSV